MKKIYLFLTFAALVCFAASSCNQQSPDNAEPEVIEEPIIEENPEPIIEVITAAVNVSNPSPSVKSEINSSTGAFTWTEGDNVAYHVASSSSHVYLKTTSDGSGGNGRGAFDLTSGNTLASFTCEWTDATIARDAFAVYPDIFVGTDPANYGQSGTSLDMVFPSSYSYAECGENKTPSPMISDNDSGTSTWAFKQVCGLLRIVINNVPPGTDNLTVTLAGKDLCGSFSIASPVTPGTSCVEAKDGSNSTIAITDIPESDIYQDGITINLPLPVGSYDTNLTVTCYDDATIKQIQTVPFSYTASRAHGKRVKMNLAAYTVNSEGLQVGFAPGNLQARILSLDPNTSTVYIADAWRFASTQYEFLGTTGNSTFAVGEWVDLFGFVGASAKYDNCGVSITGNSKNAYGNVTSELLKTDWGANEIGPYPANFWRTSTASSQSNGELHYMLLSRTASTVNETANAKFAKGSVNGIEGLILFPDIYTHPAGVTQPTNINSTISDYSGNNYSLSDWTKMEYMGCIFLPAAGKRTQTTVSRYSGDTGKNITGWYRINLSAPSEANNAYRLAFTGGVDGGDSPTLNTSTQDRKDGFSVRLQRDLP